MLALSKVSGIIITSLISIFFTTVVPQSANANQCSQIFLHSHSFKIKHDLIQKILGKKDVTDFPRLNIADFRNISPLAKEDGFSGQGHGGLFQAELEGLRVFLKVSKRNTLQELQHSTILSAFDLGPRLHGWTSLNGVNFVLVYSFVDGFHMNPYSPIPPDFPSTPSIPARILEISQILTDLGYKHTKDLQFRISRGGQVYVVDTEMFSYDVPAQFLNLPEEYRPLEQPLQSGRRLAHRIEQRNIQLHKDSGR